MKKLISLSLCLAIFTTHPTFSMNEDEDFDKFHRTVTATPTDEDTPSACGSCLGYLDPRAWTPRSKALGLHLLTFWIKAAIPVSYLYYTFYGAKDTPETGTCPAPQCVPEINFNNFTKYIAHRFSSDVNEIICSDPLRFLQEFSEPVEIKGRVDWLNKTLMSNITMTFDDFKNCSVEFAGSLNQLPVRIFELPPFSQHKLVFDYMILGARKYECHYTAIFEECDWKRDVNPDSNLTELYNNLTCRMTLGTHPHYMALIFKNGQPYKDLSEWFAKWQ